MKISFLITELNSGGAEWQLARLACNLQKRGHEVKVYTLYGDGEVAEWLRKESIAVHIIDFDHPYKLWKLVKLWRLLRKHRPAVFHTWMFHANIVGKIIGQAAGNRNIVSSLRVAEKRRKLHVIIERATSFLNSAITVNSPGLLQFALKHKFPATKLKFIPNSINLELFTFSPPSPPAPALNQPWELLYLGRIAPQKGLPYLVDAIAEVKNFHNIKLDIIGAKASEKTLKSLCLKRKKNRLEDKINIKPPVMHQYIPGLMNKYHLLILPSLWEGMPNVILEAFAAGLPVVATNIEGSNDLVRSGKTGYLVEPADSHALADCIKQCLGNYDKAIAMCHKARDSLAEQYNPEDITDRYLEAYSWNDKH